jgi:xanthine dehydrogenase accessory factor
MQKMGMASDMVGKLVCPIGLTTIKDKAPAAIAASVAAQVLMAREAATAAAANHNTQPGRARHG